jgi:hypothetical protein
LARKRDNTVHFNAQAVFTIITNTVPFFEHPNSSISEAERVARRQRLVLIVLSPGVTSRVAQHVNYYHVIYVINLNNFDSITS